MLSLAFLLPIVLPALAQEGGEPAAEPESSVAPDPAPPWAPQIPEVPGAGWVSAEEHARACAEDRALMEALLVLATEDEESALAGVEMLGSLGNPRAAAPLGHAARTREVPVAVAAAEALAAYPSANHDLGLILASREVPVEVRVAAADALGRMGTGAHVLLEALEQPRLPAEVRAAALDAIRRYYPEEAPAVAGEVSRAGTGWLMAGGAEALGFTLATAGHFGQADLEALGFVTGGLAGGTLGWVAGRTWPVEAADAAFLTTTGTAGLLGGVLVVDAIEPFSDEDSGWIGGLAGEVVGFGLGRALMERHPGTVGDAWEATFVSGASGLAAGTGTWFATQGDEEVMELVMGLGFMGGMAAGHLAAPRITVSPQDRGMVLLAGTWGTMAGGLVPVGWMRRYGLGWTGMSAGLLAGYGLSAPLEVGNDTALGGFAGLGYGSLLGLGTADLAGAEDEEVFQTAVLAAGTAGMAAGSWLAWRNPEGVEAGDVVLSGLAASWTLWQSLGWGAATDAPSDLAGLNAVLPAAAGAGTALASPLLNVHFGDSLAAASLGLWGAYGGAVTSALIGADEPLILPLVLSDVGLGAGIVLMSPLVDASPVVVGLADAGGVLGAAAAALGAAFITDETDPILAASLVGAGLGALGGGLAGRTLDRRQPEGTASLRLPDLPRLPGEWSVAPAALPGEHAAVPGARLSVTGW